MAEFDSVIPPGGVGKVTAEVHTTSFKGPIAKSVTVTTDDPSHASTRLTIRATVQVAVDVSPRDFLTAKGEIGAFDPIEATVFSVGGEPFDILGVVVRPEALTVTVEPVTHEPTDEPRGSGADGATTPPSGRKERKAKAARQRGGAGAGPARALASGASRYRVVMTPTDQLPPTRTVEVVTVKTSHPKAPEVILRLSLVVTGPVTVRPERVDLRPDPKHPGEAPKQTVVVAKEKGEPLRIEEVKTTTAAFTPTLRELREGRLYAIDVRYQETPGQRTTTGQLVITTNEPTQPTITVPLVGRH